MAMLPHERSLVTRFQDRPFVLLAVSCDQDRDTVQRAVVRHHLDWAHWWDGPDGPVFSEWGVRCLPTVYVLDGNGVVRYRCGMEGGDQLQAVIEGLLRELEGGGGERPQSLAAR